MYGMCIQFITFARLPTLNTCSRTLCHVFVYLCATGRGHPQTHDTVESLFLDTHDP